MELTGDLQLSNKPPRLAEMKRPTTPSTSLGFPLPVGGREGVPPKTPRPTASAYLTETSVTPTDSCVPARSEQRQSPSWPRAGIYRNRRGGHTEVRAVAPRPQEERANPAAGVVWTAGAVVALTERELLFMDIQEQEDWPDTGQQPWGAVRGRGRGHQGPSVVLGKHQR